MSSSLTQPIAESNSPQRDMLGQIQQLVARNTRRWRWLTILEGLGLGVSAVLGYLWLVFWLDSAFHLSQAGRVLAGCGVLASLVWLGWNWARRWRQLRFTEDQVALAIERRTPGGIQNRLINALQIARTSNSDAAELSRAVIEENVERIKQLELEQAAAAAPAYARVGVALLFVAIGGLFYLMQPERFTNAASRILMPFVNIAPLYRTTLTVQPGDIEAVGDVPLVIEISGERPHELTLLVEDSQGQRRSETLSVPKSGPVQHTLAAVQKSLAYAVRGNDFTTRFYQITVPTPSHLALARGVYHYPAYTAAADKRFESASGNLEALRGTRIEVEFVLDHPCEAAWLVMERAADAELPRETLPLQRIDSTRFSGQFTLADQAGYVLGTQQLGRPAHLGSRASLRVIDDQEPLLEFKGLAGKSEVAIDGILPLTLLATDDFGLAEVGLFARTVELSAAKNKPAAGDTKEVANTAGEWRSIEVWAANNAAKFEQTFDLNLLVLGAAEGEQLELVLRGRDRDPAKGERWSESSVQRLKVGGEAAALQLQYEQILRSEAELKEIVATQKRVLAQVTDSLRQLDGEGEGGKVDEAKKLESLATAVAARRAEQTALREQASRSARSMLELAGNPRISLGMLADTEMVRGVRILDSVATRDTPVAKRAALSDAQLTMQRTLTSLQQIFEQYVSFRQDWELSHLTPLVKMLADRQAALRDASLLNADRPKDKLTDLWQASALRRQEKLRSLVELCERSCLGLSERLEDIGSTLAESFAKASSELAAAELLTALDASSTELKNAQWANAARQQTLAAERLAAVHAALRKAELDAAKAALTALEELAKTDPLAKQMLARLKAGEEKNLIDAADKLVAKEIIHMQELVAGKKGGEAKEGKVEDYLFPDSKKHILQQPDSGKRQQFEILKLGNSMEKTPSFPNSSDREGNAVKPHVQEEFEDLVGKLLEEADEMLEKYETHNLNAAFNINEGGEVGKLGGDMNSTAAAASTGNKKPPTTNVGGVLRSGRRGACAHGLVMGDEAVNRRGRDQVQEGQERVADQAGLIKETQSDDPQKDTSTGVGGKRVESDDTKFSVADVGKWTDDMAQRMGKVQNKNYIVERQDGRMDLRVAEMLRDMTSEHEQIIERVKAVRKELKNLYLPTDHLDEILAELNGQLDRLKERPSPELFRHEQQTLDKLRGALKVFHQAHAGFQPSVPREQVVRGRILDDADRPAPAGYEQAVKRYYERLSGSGSSPSQP